MNKRLLTTIVTSCTLLLFTSICHASGLYYSPKCEGPECLKTAEKTVWPSALRTPDFTLTVGRFSLSLKRKPVRVNQTAAGDLFFVNQDKSWISIHLEDKFVRHEKEVVPQKTTLTVADSAELAFIKTIKDKEPSDPNDLWVWRLALASKKHIFVPGHKVYTAQKENLKIYFWEDNQVNGQIAYIFDSGNRSSYAYLHGSDIPFEEFKEALGSIHLK